MSATLAPGASLSKRIVVLPLSPGGEPAFENMSRQPLLPPFTGNTCGPSSCATFVTERSVPG